MVPLFGGKQPLEVKLWCLSVNILFTTLKFNFSFFFVYFMKNEVQLL